MQTQPPEDGVSVYVTWGMIQWAFAAMWSMLVAGLAWLLRLGQRVDRLEAKIATMPDRQFIEEQTVALEQRIDRLYERMVRD